MLTHEISQPERFVTGGATQRIIRDLSGGIMPTQIYSERFQEPGQTESIQQIVAHPYDPYEHPAILRDLERERLKASQMTSAVEAYLQAGADADIAELAADDTTTWSEILDSMRTNQPEAWQLTHQELPEHPEPIIDLVATISSLNHISTVDASEKLSARDPGWRDAFRSARLHGELTINKMNEIIDSLIYVKPEFREAINQLRQYGDFSTYADGLSALLRQECGVKIHPRVIVMGLNHKANNDLQYLHRDIEPDMLGVRVANALTAFEVISAYTGILRNHGYPEASLVPLLLSEGNIKQMASWTQRTFRRLPFSYVSGMPPDLRYDVNEWLAMVAEVSKTAKVDSDGTIILPPSNTQGATRGHCPVQHSVEETQDPTGQNGIAAAYNIEDHSRRTLGAHPRLVKEVVRGSERLRTVRLGEMYIANATLIAAKTGGPLDPNTAQPLWRFM